ncbi:Transposable element Tcb1 transposase [Anabarilius grahami]|uniref:Transposable element Tcb1 transposase n=1 Tax=Anabarilius grahami TaxID=495550 RepID=A0A3N0Z202_ANAGA|nr:Transposable element Tcb1 transposase [Anabarilius grahami]
MPQMSQVLRERAIGMLTAGMSTRAVARELNVHFSTISRLQRRFREFGSTYNRPHNRRTHVTTPAQDLHIQHLHLQDHLRPATCSCCNNRADGRQRLWRCVGKRFADFNVVDRVAHGGGGVMDMSPIEHVWDALDRRIRQRVPVPSNIQQLRTSIEEEWTNIPQAIINNLINSMRRRCVALRTKKQIVRVKVKSGQNLNDPIVKKVILQWWRLSVQCNTTWFHGWAEGVDKGTALLSRICVLLAVGPVAEQFQRFSVRPSNRAVTRQLNGTEFCPADKLSLISQSVEQTCGCAFTHKRWLANSRGDSSFPEKEESTGVPTWLCSHAKTLTTTEVLSRQHAERGFLLKNWLKEYTIL